MKWYRVHLMDNGNWLKCQNVKHYLVEADNESDAISKFALTHWNEIQAFRREYGVACDVQAYPENRCRKDGREYDVSGKLIN